MNPMLNLPDEDLMMNVREHMDSAGDLYLDEIERRFLVMLLKLRASEAGVSVPTFLGRMWDDAA